MSSQRFAVGVCVCLFVLTCRAAAAQTVVGSVPVPSTSYAEVSVNPNTDRVYLGGGFAVNQFAVVNATDPTMPVVVTSGASTGSGMVINPVTNLYYTTNGFGGLVQRFDGTTLAANGSVSIGACPGAFDVDTATNLIYVTRQCGGGGAPLGVDPLYVVNGATMAIVGNNLGSGGVVGSVRVNSTTGRAYVNRGTSVTIFGPSPGFALGGTLPEMIGAINSVTNRLYLIASGNLVIRDGSNEALITTIMGVGGLAAVNTSRNRIYTMTGGQINVIDGASNTSLGSFSLGPGVTATGAMAVDSAKNRLYAVGVSAGAARLYVVDDNPVDPGCQVQMSQSAYVNGDTVTISVFRISNLTSGPVNVELKFWLGSDAFAPISLANVPTIPLPSGFDQSLGPVTLFPVTAAWPRGDYEVGCRLLDPVTGKTRSQSIAPFAIQ